MGLRSAGARRLFGDEGADHNECDRSICEHPAALAPYVQIALGSNALDGPDHRQRHGAWYSWLGGAPEDLRWRGTGRRFYQWHARHEKHFVNRRSIANLGVVFSERTNAFYHPPGGDDPTEFLQGL